jgi:nicotinamide mononucleotide transporter
MDDLFDPLTNTAFALAGSPVSWAEALGFLTGLAAVWAAARASIVTFPIGIANGAFFLVLFADAGLYADAGLQIVFIALCAGGWWAWLRRGPQQAQLPITTAGPVLLAAVALLVIGLTVALMPILREAHGSAPELDALTASMSIGAQILLNLKKLESWWLWIAVDVIYVPLYLSRDLLLTAIVYAVFLVICIGALQRWRERVEAPAPAVVAA